MEYKQAIEILTKMLKDNASFSAEEKEVILTAIGVLDMGVLGKNRLRAIIEAKREKREKGVKWQ
jgi:hypothetical protein